MAMRHKASLLMGGKVCFKTARTAEVKAAFGGSVWLNGGVQDRGVSHSPHRFAPRADHAVRCEVVCMNGLQDAQRIQRTSRHLRHTAHQQLIIASTHADAEPASVVPPARTRITQQQPGRASCPSPRPTIAHLCLMVPWSEHGIHA